MFAVIVEVNALTGDDGAWTKSVDTPFLVWEGIQPVDCVFSYFNHNSWWHVGEWKRIVYSPHSLFESPYEPLDVTNMFISCCLIQSNLEVG